MRRAGGFQRDRLVIPFQLACGSCYMCDRQLNTQCEDGAVNIVLKP
jgi:threonine dehydrogenase-like Zn-dependent dehydrogenase